MKKFQVFQVGWEPCLLYKPPYRVRYGYVLCKPIYTVRYGYVVCKPIYTVRYGYVVCKPIYTVRYRYVVCKPIYTVRYGYVVCKPPYTMYPKIMTLFRINSVIQLKMNQLSSNQKHIEFNSLLIWHHTLHVNSQVGIDYIQPTITRWAWIIYCQL